MNKTKPAKATEDYVDASVDGQRQYAETLFINAMDRVEKSIERILKEQGKQVKLPVANTTAALLLKSRLTDLLDRYYDLTGQRVVSIKCEGMIKIEVML
jgi:hypothetical protein